MSIYDGNICRHYWIPQETRTCKICGSEFSICPECAKYTSYSHLCCDCEIIQRRKHANLFRKLHGLPPLSEREPVPAFVEGNIRYALSGGKVVHAVFNCNDDKSLATRFCDNKQVKICFTSGPVTCKRCLKKLEKESEGIQEDEIPF